jgi:hypothetical protein
MVVVVVAVQGLHKYVDAMLFLHCAALCCSVPVVSCSATLAMLC